MSFPDLGSRAAALEQALRILERGLEDTRGEWDDSARRLFDRSHTEPVLLEGRRQVDELNQAASELAAAVRVLQSL